MRATPVANAERFSQPENTQMKERIGPWIPAIFSAALALIVTIGNLWGLVKAGTDGAANSGFIIFMPMCFFFVGAYFAQLRNEIQTLQRRLDALDSAQLTPRPMLDKTGG